MGLVEMLAAGGPIVGLLILLSITSIGLIGAKTLALRGILAGDAARDAAFALWSQGDRVGALGTLGTVAPADRILRLAMEGLTAGQRRTALEGDLEWRGNAELTAMNHHIRLLELIAMVSPLLGLLGTVLGMIRAFQGLAEAQGAANASVLAGGIWEALLTTAAGLIVAIPAAVAASLLAERAERGGQLIEGAVGRLFAIEDGRR